MLNDREIILLGHKSGVGKDTLADSLSVFNYSKGAFAHQLKSIVTRLYKLDYEQVYGEMKNVIDIRYGLTPRQILQKFGQDQRAIDPDIWPRLVTVDLERELAYYPRASRRFVIADFRFPNEYWYLKKWAESHEMKVLAYRIDRKRDEMFAGSTDVSETALDNFEHWDGVIENNGTPHDLFNNFLLLKNFST